MAVIVEVKSPVSGKRQITAFDGFNMGLSNYGSVMLVDAGGSTLRPMVRGQVTVAGVSPVLAFMANGPVFIERTSTSGGNTTFYLRAASSAPIPVEWWCFDAAAQAMRNASAGFFVLKDLSGVETFTSAMWPLRMIGDITTLKPGVDYAAAPGDYLTSLATGAIPAGKKYAVVQATPSTIVNDYSFEDDLVYPHPWTRNVDKYSSVGRCTATAWEVGNDIYETTQTGRPFQSTGALKAVGRTRHIIVDVTDFPSAGAPGGAVITASVNATARTATGAGATTVTTTTAAVTASASGGTAPYTFTWQFVSGSPDVVANGATTGAAFATLSANQPQNSERSAVWRARVVDSLGSVGYTPDVTFTHVAALYDISADPWTTANQSRTSTAEYYQTAVPDHTLTGVNQPVTLRLTMSGLSSNVVTTGLHLFKNGVEVAYKTWSNGSIEASFSAGDVVGIMADAQTDNGTRSGSFTLTLTNQTDGGAILTQFTNTLTVDSDNSSAPDFVPNAVATLTSIAPNTPNQNAVGTPRQFQVLGINQPITIRVQRSAVSSAGNLSKKYLKIYTSTDGTNYTLRSTLTTDSAFYDVAVTNGMWVQVAIEVETSSGLATAKWNVTFYNQSASNAVITTMAVDATVDNDNNFNVADLTPDTVNWPNVTQSIAADSTTFGGTVQTFSGITGPITVRVAITFRTGDTVASQLQVSKNGSLVTAFDGMLLNASTDVTIVNGNTMTLGGYVATTDGTKAGTVGVTVTNISTGAVLDTFTYTFTIDSDNSSGPADYSAANWSWSNVSITTASNYISNQVADRTISGVNRPINLRVQISAIGGNGQMGAAGLQLLKNGASLGSVEWIAGATKYVDGTFNNGDVIAVFIDAQSFSAFKSTVTCTVTIYNQSNSNAVLAQYTYAATVFSAKPNP